MKIIVCDMCGCIKDVDCANEIYIKRDLLGRVNKFLKKIRGKNILNPKDVNSIARSMFMANESNITAERIAAIREIDLCEACFESTLKYYDKLEKKENIK